MPLTAAEVRATKFATTRMRAGYDMDEVDAFLDIVEADLAQLSDELQRSRDGEAVLRTQCAQLQGRLNSSEERLSEVRDALEAAKRKAPATAPPDVSAVVQGHPEAESILAIAERTADEIIRYARSQADTIRSETRALLKKQLAALDDD